VSVLGDEQQRADSLAGLDSSHGFLQGRVASELRLKHTPQLDFRYDDSADRGQRISELLREERPSQ
jgi:ribosome-binding factor A